MIKMYMICWPIKKGTFENFKKAEQQQIIKTKEKAGKAIIIKMDMISLSVKKKKNTFKNLRGTTTQTIKTKRKRKKKKKRNKKQTTASSINLAPSSTTDDGTK